MQPRVSILPSLQILLGQRALILIKIYGGSPLIGDDDVSGGVGPIDTDKIKDELGDDFYKDGDKLVFYIDNPTIYGRSESFAVIKLRLDFDEFQTTADDEGSWQYTFSNVSKGEHTLFIYEYTKDGALIKTTSYPLTIADKPLSVGEDSISFLSRWWLLLLLLIVASYLYYRSRTKRTR